MCYKSDFCCGVHCFFFFGVKADLRLATQRNFSATGALRRTEEHTAGVNFAVPVVGPVHLHKDRRVVEESVHGVQWIAIREPSG